jgi:hypothetical protein
MPPHASWAKLALARFVSRVVTGLVAGAGVTFTRRNPRELKGLPGRWDLFAAA